MEFNYHTFVFSILIIKPESGPTKWRNSFNLHLRFVDHMLKVPLDLEWDLELFFKQVHWSQRARSQYNIMWVLRRNILETNRRTKTFYRKYSGEVFILNWAFLRNSFIIIDKKTTEVLFRFLFSLIISHKFKQITPFFEIRNFLEWIESVYVQK